MPQGRCTKAAVLRCCIHPGVMQTPGPRGLSYVASPLEIVQGGKNTPPKSIILSRRSTKNFVISRHDNLCLLPLQNNAERSSKHQNSTVGRNLRRVVIRDHFSLPHQLFFPSHHRGDFRNIYFIWGFALSFHLRVYLAESPTSISSVAQYGMFFPAV